MCAVAVCGDGIIREGFEECDDGNADEGDDCTDRCFNAYCGDGVVRVGLEQCDDGNSIGYDTCHNFCVEGLDLVAIFNEATTPNSFKT